MSSDATQNRQDIAARFVAARRTGSPIPSYPGQRPETLDEAYAVQDVAIALTDQAIAGWKVGRIEPPIEARNRLAGPIFADMVVPEGDTPPAMAIFEGGFAAAEAEFLLRIGTAPDPDKLSYTLAEAIVLIDAVHIGIEIASSPYGGINDDGPAVTISDFGNNNGLVLGQPIIEWRDVDLNDWPVELLINGESAGRATTATMLDGPFGAARFLFEALAERGIPLEPGQWISTGAVTGVHAVTVGDRIEARFDDRMRVACTIKAHG